MAEEGKEFWRDLKPIAQTFRPGAAPEAYIANAATDDDRFYAPLSETVSTRPLWMSPTQNRWCDVLMCRGAGLVNRHYHPQQVFAYTISGWVWAPTMLSASSADSMPRAPRAAPIPRRPHRPATVLWLEVGDDGEVIRWPHAVDRCDAR